MVIYTSGTTGKPKGPVHTHGGFPLKMAHDSKVHFDVRQGDVVCWPADMGWIAGPLVSTMALLTVYWMSGAFVQMIWMQSIQIPRNFSS